MPLIQLENGGYRLEGDDPLAKYSVEWDAKGALVRSVFQVKPPTAAFADEADDCSPCAQAARKRAEAAAKLTQ